MAELPDVLQRIVTRRAERLAGERLGPPSPYPGTGEVAEPATPTGAGPRPGDEFLDALRRRRGNAIVAEVKLGSPKLGSLQGRIDPERQATAYADHGAAALSVVVEPDFFFGSYQLLERCRTASGLPAIAKDFVIDERQLRWARDAGAGAVLLIAATVDAVRLADLAVAARELGLVPLVETHDRTDLAKLRPETGTDAAWELVGINNRDLRTFRVDLERSIRLLPRLPRSALKVAESGIGTRADIERLAAAGFDAFLIGESLLLADDPGAHLRQLLGTEPS